jgi:hypothetical protein
MSVSHYCLKFVPLKWLYRLPLEAERRPPGRASFLRASSLVEDLMAAGIFQVVMTYGTFASPPLPSNPDRYVGGLAKSGLPARPAEILSALIHRRAVSSAHRW